MSVLQRKELEDSPLADLHAIASELGVEGYRALRREDLVAAVIEAQGGDPSASQEPEAGDVADGADSEPAPADGDSSPRGRRGRRRSGGSRSTAARGDEERRESRSAASGGDEERREVTGKLELRSNGSGVLTVDGEPDLQIHVSPAQIRRCELRSGDEVTGPIRPPKTGERRHSLLRVNAVNGEEPASRDEEERSGSGSGFERLTPVFPTDRFAGVAAFGDAPIGKGARVALIGQSGAGATTLLRTVAAQLKELLGGEAVTVVLADARPEELGEWRSDGDLTVVGGSFDEASRETAQAAAAALKEAKRIAEGGGDAAILIDSLEGLPGDVARRLIGAGRKLEEGGSLTVIGAVRPGSVHLRLATTVVDLEGAAPGDPIKADRTRALRADLLS